LLQAGLVAWIVQLNALYFDSKWWDHRRAKPRFLLRSTTYNNGATKILCDF